VPTEQEPLVPSFKSSCGALFVSFKIFQLHSPRPSYLQVHSTCPCITTPRDPPTGRQAWVLTRTGKPRPSNMQDSPQGSPAKSHREWRFQLCLWYFIRLMLKYNSTEIEVIPGGRKGPSNTCLACSITWITITDLLWHRSHRSNPRSYCKSGGFFSQEYETGLLAPKNTTKASCIKN
jgi:hypothetical protein